MSFDTRLLTGVGVFGAVMEAGNFVRAADVLGLTPSGVSRAVARLEQRVGVRLFDRSPRKVTLTEEGVRFHARIMPLLAGLEEAASEAAGSAAFVGGRIRVSIDPWFARMLLAPRIGEFLALYPALTLDLTTSNYREEMMSGADVAVRFGPPDESSLIARKLLDVPVLTCAAPGYLERHGVPVTPHDLMRHDCILFRDPQTGRPFTWEFQGDNGAIEIKVAGRLVMDDPSAAVAACLAGQGIFQSFAIGLDEWLESGALTTILTEWSGERFPLYAYHPSRHMPPAKVRAFLDFVQRIAVT